MKYQENFRNFNPPNANGLKQDLLERNGWDYIFRVGKGRDVPIRDKSKVRIDYSIFMGGDKIGTLTEVHGPDFYDIIYDGRIPGYVNEGINEHNKNRANKISVPIDKVILRHMAGNGRIKYVKYKPGRQDGHTKLRFP